MPVLGQRVFQAAADHPAGSRIIDTATLKEMRRKRLVDDLLLVKDVSDSKSPGDVRHPATEGVSNSRSEGEQVICPEARIHFVSRRGTLNCEIDRVRIAQPEIAAGRFQSEHPVVPLEIVS